MHRTGIVTLFLLILTLRVFATHQRAAEITYTWVEGLTYEVTITMYTYTPSPADDSRTSLPVFWGDNTGDEIPRIVFVDLPDNYSLNIYRMRHTYPAPGSYTIAVEDPNRNFGVVNIPNSVNVPMFVQSELVINPFLGINNSVQLLNPPIDQGCVGKTFIHNPAAFDPDGDSLSFRLVKCKGAGGFDIPGYTLPQASISFEIDPISGDLIWETPVLQGEYNVAFIVEEWRNGIRIGSVTRDMQILIGACDNNPPEIITISDTCVLAGTVLTFDVTAIDPDGNKVTLTANGGPFELSDSPAAIIPDPATGNDTVTTTFFWNTNCSHIRKNPYTVLFKARDEHPVVNLTNLKAVEITVIAPALNEITAIALGNGIDLSWTPTNCSNALGYRIYRRNGASGYQSPYCQTGVPATTGYQLIQSIGSATTTSYRDDNNGQGLTPGIEYCYMVTYYFADGAESQVITEACAGLKRDLPVMTHVSNDSIDLNSGRVLTAWSKPVDLDQQQYPGPYRYFLLRSDGTSADELIFTGIGLDDTLFADNAVNLNQASAAFRYTVLLNSLTVGDIGFSKPAESVFITATGTDREIRLSWNPFVPWLNEYYEVFRLDPGSSTYVFAGTTSGNIFRDKNLDNEQTYCYYVRSVGSYSSPGIISPIVNYSQIVCGQPLDDVPPCAPQLTVSTDCETVTNILDWVNLYDSCSYDIAKYYIYYTPQASLPFALIDSVSDPGILNYLHSSISFITGCYYIKAKDYKGNLSASSNVVCVNYDACPLYELPNFFSPNNDLINDLLVPLNYPSANPKANVDRVEMIIFNRWGRVVFKTNDPMINWDGRNQENGKECVDGVYFYTCKAFFRSLEGETEILLKGSITIIR
jgi:gliding motility-associated-like protein